MEIENDYLKVNVKEDGGSLSSIFDKKTNKELLYQPIPTSWQGQDVVIFPFVARLKEGTFAHKGKEYSLKNHGLIRYMKGKAKQINKEELSIEFVSDANTLGQYPFSFILTAHYKLIENKLFCKYIIENTGEENMPFMVGGHPAFKLPGINKEEEFDISGNIIKFDDVYDLKRMDMNENFSFCKRMIAYKKSNQIQLNKNLFKEINTIILCAKDFNKVDLVKTDSSIIRIHKNNIPYLALWSDLQYGDYVAIEPWNGLPDFVDAEKEISRKNAINCVKPHSFFTFNYEIEVL